MNWTIEVVCVPVSDVDRAKAFYADQLGFTVDFDSVHDAEVRQVQLTPPGSGCSIAIGTGIYDWPGIPVPARDMAPGALQGLRLVVRDIRAAHAELVERGVAVTDIHVYGKDLRLRPYRDGDELHNVGFFLFDDPDGNGWSVQQISTRE
ncbi:MAG TPA: VOC family protein [Acidimicrobiales bacterium]|nr:VOC family protein [Acidimicrobiales bacterium]